MRKNARLILHLCLHAGAVLIAAQLFGVTGELRLSLLPTRALRREPVRDTKLGLALFDALAEPDRVATLLRQGADPNAHRGDGHTPLMASVGGHTLPGACFSDPRDESAREVSRLLLASGANVNAVDHEGRSALGLAAATGSEVLVKQLLEAGAAVNHRDHQGRTPLSLSADRLPRIRQQLLARGAIVGVVEAILLGKRQRAKVLLAGCVDLKAQGRHGESLLMLAAWREYPELVRELLRQGQNVNAQDDEGFTALSLAIGGRHRRGQVSTWEEAYRPATPERRETVRLLLAAGAKPGLRSKDWDRCSALDAAVATDQPSLARLLRRAVR